MTRSMILAALLHFALSAATAAFAVEAKNPEPAWETVASPNQTVRMGFALRDGKPVYSVWYRDSRIIEPSALGLRPGEPYEGGFEQVRLLRQSVRKTWKPLYGERDTIPDCYDAMVVELRERGSLGRTLRLQIRAYDEGVAFRYVFPDPPAKPWRIEAEHTEFRFVPGCAAYPIHGGEATFSKEPVALEKVGGWACVPLTVRLPNGFAAVLEAYAMDYPRMGIGTVGDGALAVKLMGPVEVAAPLASPWRVILLGKDEGQLIGHEHLVLTLNPPCAIEDTSWIQPGMTISNEESAHLRMDELTKVIEFAGANGFGYLQLDWGWYGTETPWNKQQVEAYRKYVPEKFQNTNWEANTLADPNTVAKGFVPYRPSQRWKDYYNVVDLDMPELVQYCRQHKMGLCLYVEAGATLPSQDMDKLFARYQQWGLAGLKPGFVKYGQQRDTQWIRRLVETAAKHRLWLCIHDAYVPEGMERTYPNLFIVEGGGGEEGHHPVQQDVMLPFTRCLAGPFDYTPALYARGRSHAHMLAFFVVYYGPTQVVRGGYPAWTTTKGPGRGGVELEFLRRVPTTWNETKVLGAQIGQQIIVARRHGDTWFLGGMTGDKAETVKLPLDFLSPGRSYTATIYADDPAAAADGWCPAKRESKEVTSASTLTVAMEKAGGCVAIFEPRSGGDAQQADAQ